MACFCISPSPAHGISGSSAILSTWHHSQFRHPLSMASLPFPPCILTWRGWQFRHVQVPAAQQFCLQTGVLR
ncbi:hypothetical protein L195_g032262 [Trifolium pratense]|uniref:Uncharacterized protein n=1 Tax=Trifolium pratense TaxID=57577 RepID=A0A2K3LCR4_TRIPR|nr:hypothetical protein L195_g032262 [Trifolium pratense]